MQSKTWVRKFSRYAELQDSLEYVIVFCAFEIVSSWQWNQKVFFSLGSINILISPFCVLSKAIFIIFTPTSLAYL